jgi:hypothetical protein
MADYCGTADCLLLSRDWTDLTLDGTTNYAGDIITAASAWVTAEVNDWRTAVSPLSDGGTLYDYHIQQAAANRACFIAYDSVMRDKYEVEETPYWYSFKNESERIMTNLRDAYSVMTEDTSVWERGIAPAVGVANGTVSAPYTGIMISNAEVTSGIYTANDNIPRTIVIELDGTGTVINDQTYKWMYLGGTAWEATAQSITVDGWHSVIYGVEICFPSQADSAVAVEQRSSWDMQLG